MKISIELIEGIAGGETARQLFDLRPEATFLSPMHKNNVAPHRTL